MTIACPKCSSKAYKKNGFTRHGKQNHRCLDCGRQFSLEPESNFVVEVKGQPNKSELPMDCENNPSSENIDSSYNNWISR